MKKIIILHLILLLFVTAGFIYTQSGEVNPESILNEATDYYRKANALLEQSPERAEEFYQKALIRFEGLVKDKNIRNSKLYYNLANTYFMTGNLGKAILNYRRSQELSASDVNLKQNLEYARSKRIDKIEEKKETRALKIFLFWHYDISLKTRFYIASTAFSLIWLFAIIRLLFKKALFTWLAFLFSFLTACFAASVVSEEIYKDIDGVITVKKVVARKGNGESYEPSFENPLHEGTEFKLVENRKEWYYIELVDGKQCWIPADSAELISSR